MSSKSNYLDVVYDKKKLIEFEYSRVTTLKDLKQFLAEKYFLLKKNINLKYDKINLEDDSILLSKFLMTTLSKINDKIINVRILPQIHMKTVMKKVKLNPLEHSEEDGNNFIEFDVDLIQTTLEEFKKKIKNIFIDKMEELNYKLDKEKCTCEFYVDPQKEALLFADNISQNNYSFTKHLTDNDPEDDIKFYFLLKSPQIEIFKKKISNLIEIHDEIILKKKCKEGETFIVILQTYDSVFKELEVFPEMTVFELKEMIEEELKIRKDFQELLYLVYKLKEDNKMLKDYHIRPRGIIFLRGFYFPLVFIDYYKKSIKNVIGINLAQSVSNIKFELVRRLNLDFENFCLISNGKELCNEKNLIDYNIQKMQSIYLK